jgi:GT2 family glycosyltransferase
LSDYTVAEPIALSFIVPVRNDADGLNRCLTSIAAAAAPYPFEVIVVDNGSVDGSGNRGRALGATVLTIDGRLGRLRNQAATVARGRLLAFVDADHELGARWAHAALARLEDDSIAAVGAPYHPPPAGNWVQEAYDLLRDHRPGIRDAAWLGSGNLVVRRDSFLAVGGFDESFETCEDVDLCQRLRRAGFRVLADSELYTTHHGDPTTLRRLFTSELWRGRDNLRVSMRASSLRDFPSILIPVLDLFAGVSAPVSIALWGWQGLPIALSAVGVVAGVAWLRTTRMATRAKVGTLQQVLQAYWVALLYDIARALALIVRRPHRRVGGPLTTD